LDWDRNVQLWILEMIAQLGRSHIDYLYVQVSHLAEVPLDLTQWTSLWFKTLKKRLCPRKPNGESIENKVGNDCYVLYLATLGDFCEDLKITLR
jgi:hypothetical protein